MHHNELRRGPFGPMNRRLLRIERDDRSAGRHFMRRRSRRVRSKLVKKTKTQWMQWFFTRWTTTGRIVCKLTPQ